jgi:hypothetical protein
MKFLFVGMSLRAPEISRGIARHSENAPDRSSRYRECFCFGAMDFSSFAIVFSDFDRSENRNARVI